MSHSRTCHTLTPAAATVAVILAATLTAMLAGPAHGLEEYAAAPTPVPDTCTLEPEVLPASIVNEPGFKPLVQSLAVPTVIRGGLTAAGWAGPTKWTWASLAQTLKDEMFIPVWVRRGPGNITFAREDTEAMTPEDVAFWTRAPRSSVFERFVSRDMHAQTMLARLDKAPSVGDGGPDLLLYYSSMLADLPALIPDVQPLDPFVFPDGDPFLSLWISSPGVVAHAHWDRNWNMFGQVLGKKRLTIIPPHSLDAIHPFPVNHPSWTQAQVEFLHPDPVLFPSLASLNGSCYTIDVGPGDILHIPPYFMHHVHTLESSFSLSQHSYTPELRAQIKANADAYGTAIPLQEGWSQRHTLGGLMYFFDGLVGDGDPDGVISGILSVRYAPLVDIPTHDPASCPGAKDDVSAEQAKALLDAGRAVRDLQAGIASSVRVQYVRAYIEEVTGAVAGIEGVVPFLTHCFGQGSRAPHPPSPTGSE